MGGYGSARRYGSKDTTGDYLRLDVRRLQSGGLLDRRFAFSWQWSRRGEQTSTFDLRIIA
jgi:hypothetical protein